MARGTNTVFLTKMYFYEGYLPQQESWQNDIHESSTSNLNHPGQQRTETHATLDRADQS